MIKLPERMSRPKALQTSTRSGPLPPVTVHIFNDIACPWCYIGTRRLQRAVRQYKRRYGQAAPVKLQWNPLLVSNGLTETGEDINSYAQQHWGVNSADSVRARLVRAGLPEGATFRQWKTVPNSLLALELVALAADRGVAEQANDLLFARTYEQGGNVSLLSEVLQVGQSLGISLGDLGQELGRTDAESVRARVLEQDAAAKTRLHIRAVPYFIITAGPQCRTKYSLDGAQQTSDLLGAMERVAMVEAQAATTAVRGAVTVAVAAQSYGGGHVAAASPPPLVTTN